MVGGGRVLGSHLLSYVGVWVDDSIEEEDSEEGDVSVVKLVILCLWDFPVKVPRKW